MPTPIKAKGIDAIAVTARQRSVRAWTPGRRRPAPTTRSNSSPTAARISPRRIGLELDASAGGLGIRSKRYCMVVDDGVVKSLSDRGRARQGRYLRRRHSAEVALIHIARPELADGHAQRGRHPSRYCFARPACVARFADRVARQLIGALVQVMAGMALHPMPFHLVMRRAPHRAAATDRHSSPASCRRCASRSSSSP